MDSALKLPQSMENWYLIIRQLRVWIHPAGQTPYRPYALIVENLNDGLLLHGEVAERYPTQPELIDYLSKVMLSKVNPARRPAAILVDDAQLMTALLPGLEKMGISTGRYENQESTDAMIRDLEQHMRRGASELPALCSQPGVTETLLAGLFSAAAAYYQAAPWAVLSDADLLKVQVGDEYDSATVSVLGKAGIQHGLAVHWDWQKVTETQEFSDVMLPPLPPEGIDAFYFDAINLLAFDDLDLLIARGWPVAAPTAYPAPLVLFPGGGVERPNAAVLLWYESVLLALPELVRKHVHLDDLGELLPFQVEIPVHTSSGFRLVQIELLGDD
jgi:hypothetical protein